jgi:hypothetical protein
LCKGLTLKFRKTGSEQQGWKNQIRNGWEFKLEDAEGKSRKSSSPPLFLIGEHVGSAVVEAINSRLNSCFGVTIDATPGSLH